MRVCIYQVIHDFFVYFKHLQSATGWKISENFFSVSVNETSENFGHPLNRKLLAFQQGGYSARAFVPLSCPRTVADKAAWPPHVAVAHLFIAIVFRMIGMLLENCWHRLLRFQFKARPLNQAILDGAEKLKKMEKKPSTVPVGFHLSTGAKKDAGHDQEDGKPKPFKAQPVPTEILTKVVVRANVFDFLATEHQFHFRSCTYFWAIFWTV